jgi:Zn-dependent peptidase ImmA (M78 family)
VDHLVRPASQLRFVRFRSLKRLNTRDQILDDVGRWLSDFRDLEKLLGEQQTYRLGDLAVKGSQKTANPAALAAKVRQRLEVGEKEAIRDICGLLESSGVKVYSTNVASNAFFGMSVAEQDGGPAVVVNTWERISVERWIFTAAHELGHLLLHTRAYDVRETTEKKEEEREANVFAAHFLMPDKAFQNEWNETYGMPLVDRVFKVKRIFRVSYRTVLYRLSEKLALGAQIWARFRLEYSRKFGRSLGIADEPEPVTADAFSEALRSGEPETLSPSDFSEDRLSALVRRGVERGVISLSRGAEILRLSVRDMRDLASSWVA